MEPKTTQIGDEPGQPLVIEWMDYHYMPNKHAISLVYPGNKFRLRSRILNLSPQTALNVLAWLEEEYVTLVQLAQEQEVQDGQLDTK